MRPAILLKCAAAALLIAGSALAQTPPEGVAWIAVRDLNDMYGDPDDPTNRPPLVTAPPEGMIRAVDVSQDGVPDWLIDYSDAGGPFCGTGGCLLRLYVSGPDGYSRAIEAQALGLDVEPGRVVAQVHHLHCADDNSDCHYTYVWDAGAGRLVETSTSSARPMGEDAWRPLPASTND